MTENKKPKSVIALGFVMVILSAIFILLAFGYGHDIAVKDCNTYYHSTVEDYIKTSINKLPSSTEVHSFVESLHYPINFSS